MNKIIFTTVILISTLISGCASLSPVGSLRFVDKSKHVYIGEFNTFSKKISVEIDGLKYEGFFITNSGSVGGVEYSGNSGKAILNELGGNTMRCEFEYEGRHAIGNCSNSTGTSYQVTTQ
jgi:hypothetical protein